MLLPYLATFVSAAMAVVIPGPPGPYSVALKEQLFEDSNRWDPFAPEDKPEKRRILVNGYIPVKDSCSTEQVTYMTPVTADALAGLAAQIGAAIPPEVFLNMEMEFCKTGEGSCGSKPSTEKYALIIFSPGLGASRLAYGILARAWASYGYIVISMDHTYDSTIIEFPDGSVVEGKYFNATGDEVRPLVDARKDDTVYLLDQLTDPDVGSEFLAGTNAAVDPERIFVFGHSLGGANAVAALHADERILGALDFDGQMQPPATTEGVDRLLVLIGRTASPEEIPGWKQIWGNLRGSGLIATIEGTEHMSYFDMLMLPTLSSLPAEYKAVIEKLLGTISGDRIQELMMGTVLAALDLVFEGKPDVLCNVEELGPEVNKVEIRGLSCS